MIDLNWHQCSELREVILYYTADRKTILPHEQRHYMMESQVATFLQATLELHYQPGINPHNGNTAALLWEAKVGKLEQPVSYWWCVPGLHKNHDQAGAQISSFVHKSLWVHPDLQVLLAQERADEERAEYESEQRVETD